MNNNKFKESLKFPTDISDQQKFIENCFHNLNNQYIRANSYEVKEYLCYLMSAIYLTYNQLYPDLSIYIPFRIKSDDSSMKNYKKEFEKEINSYTPDNNGLNFANISSDFIAATIVLDHVKSSIKTKTDYISDDISMLRLQKQKTFNFIHDIENKLDSEFLDEQQYMELKQQILEKVIEATYPEFTNERTVSYNTELNEINRSYQIKRETNSFLPNVSSDQIENVKKLLLDLRSRSSDKLEYEILRETIPIVLNSPLIKNALKVDFEFVKDSKKPNGFAALYYIIHTPYGPLELQLQSNKRYYEAKKGSAFHSGITGKEIDISSFFELVDPNDIHDLKFYLTKLDNIRADEILSDVEIPKFDSEVEKYKFLTSFDGDKYLLTQKVKEYMSHIRIKDTYEYIPDTNIRYSTYDSLSKKNVILQKPSNTTQIPVSIDTDTYLLSLAKSISPYMNVCSSGHTSFSTASIHQKNLIGEFTEILRKKDATSCLGNMLISRLRTIIKNTKDEDYLQNQQIRNLLPKDIAKEDIIQYSTEKLHPRLSDLENEEKSI